MKNHIKQNWPFVISVSIFVLISAAYVWMIVSGTQGHFIYYFDDTYIHMAIAKNFSQHGVWGVTEYGFSSASSSLFWTSLLAAVYFFAGPNEITPYIICLISSFALIASFWFIFRKEGVRNIYILVFLLLLLYLASLPPLAVSGLEHILHALVTVLFIYYGAEIVAGMRNSRKDRIIIIILSFLLPLLRYEGLVSVLLLFVLLLLSRKALLALFVLLAGILPISLFGFISIANGWSFFPNSMVMKWNIRGTTSLGDFVKLLSFVFERFFNPLNSIALILAALFVVLVIYYFRKHKNEIPRADIRDQLLVLLYMVNAILYFIFSSATFAARYQAFLIISALFVVPILLFRKRDASGNKASRIAGAAAWVSAAAVLVSLVFFSDYRSYMSFSHTVQMSKNIYEQQYQTSSFFKRFYNNSEVAVNDIGTTGFFTNARMTDLWGLADYEVSQRRSRKYSKNDLRDIASVRHIKVAIIYDSWFKTDGVSIIPEEWVKAGEWRILNNLACASNVVSIYAVDPNEKDNLIRNLRLNSAYLPPGVTESGLYKETVLE